MALQSNPSLVGFEAYISIAEGDAIDLLRGGSTEWASQTDLQKEVSIRLSSEYIDSKFNFKGVPSDEGQTMQFPRSYITPYDGIIPDPLKRATFVLARDGATDALYTNIIASAATGGGALKSEQKVLGPIETKTEYYSGTSAGSNQPVFSEVKLILKPLLQSASAGR